MRPKPKLSPSGLVGAAAGIVGFWCFMFSAFVYVWHEASDDPVGADTWLKLAIGSFAVFAIGLLVFLSQLRFSLRTLLLTWTAIALFLGTLAYLARN